MKYLGGKYKNAKYISSFINDTVINTRGGGTQTFVSLFCGSCAVECKVTGFDRKILNDNHYYLIEMYHALQNGWEPPTNVSYEEYQYIRTHKDENPPLTGFVGFACSFSGKWFGGYARAHRERRGYAREGYNALMRDIKFLQDCEFTCMDYRQVVIPANSVIYADPPYIGTTGYSGKPFDTDAFWKYMRELAVAGNKVFVSEQVAPDDIECIWERPITRTLDNKNRKNAIERLYYLGPNN